MTLISGHEFTRADPGLYQGTASAVPRTTEFGGALAPEGSGPREMQTARVKICKAGFNFEETLKRIL